MTRADVKSYFGSLSGFKLKDIKKKGEYCERCGIGIGKRYINKKLIKWKGFDVCDSCFKDKTNNELESTPDLEDLIEILKYEK